MTETLNAAVIIDELKDQANEVLSAVLGSKPLKSFNIGSKGNMPYYWEDPKNLMFNSKTYNWICSNLKNNTSPLQLDSSFTNLYMDTLRKVHYSLSTDDQAKLNKAYSKAQDQQASLLRIWKAAYGGFPDGTGQPIDRVCNEIATKWADPPTTLQAIEKSRKRDKGLNKMPASGLEILPIFGNWLNAVGASLSLVDNVTMNNVYLNDAIDAISEPSEDNGGIRLNEGDDYHPAFSMATSLSDIINGLENSDNSIDLSMDVERKESSIAKVNISGGGSCTLPILDFLTLSVGGNANYSQEKVFTSENTVSITATYPGVTLVNYGPSIYDMATSKNWYYMKPIADAIKNGDQDVSGYKFSPEPQVDFSEKGPFGFLSGVAISNYPSFKITITSDQFESIQKTFEQSVSVGISFLGIPLGISGKESTYSNSSKTDASKKSVTITLNPPKELVAGVSVDSAGWVLGVQSDFPAAD